MKNKYRITTFVLAFIICISIIYLHLLSHEKTREIYIGRMEKVVINLKRDYLKDTVNNVFAEIDRLKEAKYKDYKNRVKLRAKRLQEELEDSEEEFIRFYIDRFTEDMDYKTWTSLLWNSETGEILYESLGLDIDSIGDTILELKPELVAYSLIEKGPIKGFFGINQKYIDEIIKEEVGDLIRSRRFSNGSYIWVNEIMNYEGGKDYAIRRVHPNLPETEGKYLSTDMEDIEGNLLYLRELEGINKKGEILFSYYFKKLNSSEIAEKMTYAKLYKDYDWVIAMGVHFDEIDFYTEKANQETNDLVREPIINLLTIIFAVFLIGFLIINIVREKHLQTSTKLLRSEINIDTLTNTTSRRYGEVNLDNALKEYKLTGKKVAIMVFDIDDFKEINDKYGHSIGDIALKEIVKVISNVIRSSDILIRWGGDEFIGILPGLQKDDMKEFGEKILGEVNSLRIAVEDEVIETSISIGFSCFKETDEDFNDVLKRADKAMYISKKEGKGRVSILL